MQTQRSTFRAGFALVLALGNPVSNLGADTFSINYSVAGQRFTYDFAGQTRTLAEFSEVTNGVLVIADNSTVGQPQFQPYQFFDTCDLGPADVEPFDGSHRITVAGVEKRAWVSYNASLCPGSFTSRERDEVWTVILGDGDTKSLHLHLDRVSNGRVPAIWTLREVQDAPVAAASVAPLAFSDAPLWLDGSASRDRDSTGSIVSWEWDLGFDGTFAVDLTGVRAVVPVDQVRVYFAEGVETPIALRVRDDNGGSAFSVVTVTGGGPRPADGNTATVALVGDPAPDGGGTYSSFKAPALNENSQVGFWASLREESGGFSSGLFLGEDGEVRQHLRSGDAAPGTPGAFQSAGNAPRLNDAGEIAAASMITQAGTSYNEFGLFISDGISTRNVLVTGRNAPSGGTIRSISPMGFNNAGEALIYGSRRGDGIGFGNDTEVYVGDGTRLAVVAREGDPDPGGNGKLGDFSPNDLPALSGSGKVAFRASLTDTANGTGGEQGIYLGSAPESLITVARTGQPFPLGFGPFDGTFTTFSPPVVNESDEVAFFASGDSARTKVFRWRPGQFTVIATEFQSVPGDPAMAVAGFRNWPAVNASGEVAFVSDLRERATGAQELYGGVFKGKGFELTTVFQKGKLPPDGDGTLDFLGNHIALNDSGAVAALVSLAGTSGGPADDRAILVGDGTDTVQVAREGQKLEGSVISSLELTLPDQGGRGGFNSRGQLAYRAVLADGRQGVFLFTPKISYRWPGTGSWERADYWTLGTVPDEPHQVTIATDLDTTIAGPAQDWTVRALTLGGGAGMATLHLREGVTLRVTDSFVLLENGRITGEGALEVDSLEVGNGATPATLSVPAGLTLASGGGVNLISGATLEGDGTVRGDVAAFAGATVAPGLSPGSLAVEGDVSLEAGSTFAVEIAGDLAGDFDSLEVSGHLTLGGSLEVSLSGGFVPAVGMSIDLWNAATVFGEFDTVVLPPLPAGRAWNTADLNSTGVLKVGVPGSAPTDLVLAPATIGENVPAGSVVGSFSAVDADAGDSFAYALVTGVGDVDNAAFQISGGQLRTAIVFDHETQTSASIRVRVTDGFGLSLEKVVVMTIVDDRTEDADGDGLTEGEEEDTHGTSDTTADSDGDGFEDGFEVERGLDPASDLDGQGDRDGDGAADWLELRMGTDPDMPNSQSILAFEVTANAAGEPVVKVGPGAPGVGFRVVRTSGFDSLWLLLNDYPAGVPTGQTADFVDEEAPPGRAFYRIGAYPIGGGN